VASAKELTPTDAHLVEATIRTDLTEIRNRLDKARCLFMVHLADFDIRRMSASRHERSYNVWRAEAAPSKIFDSTNDPACCAASGECGVKSNTTEKSVPAMGDG
jgi:hypothetical protein